MSTVQSLKKNFIFLNHPPPPNQVSGSVTDTDPGCDVSRSTLLRLAQDVMLLDLLLTLAWDAMAFAEKVHRCIKSP